MATSKIDPGQVNLKEQINKKTEPTHGRAAATLAKILMPGLGFFGNTPDTNIGIKVDHNIDAIKIFISSKEPEILNLGAISFYDENGREIPRRRLNAEVSMSSMRAPGNSEKMLKSFLDGKLLHSRRESNPTLLIRLREPVFLRSITINNRQGPWACRSRFLQVLAQLNDRDIVEHKNLSRGSSARKLKSVVAQLGINKKTIFSRLKTESAISLIRSELIRHLALSQSRLTLREACCFLPVFDQKPLVEGFHLTLIAIIIVNELEKRRAVKTKFLKPLANILNSKELLTRLSDEVNSVAQMRWGTSEKVAISRHCIHRARLINSRHLYLDAIERLVSVLDTIGVMAMLGYGTLLGAVRCGEFLAHDDDVDLIAFDGSTSQATAALGRERIINFLTDSGFSIVNINLWHITIVYQGAAVDIFPSWKQDGLLFLPMESLRIRGVPYSYFFPVSSITLHGKIYPCPADSSSFLEDRYGPQWKVPDPYYEWPWEITA